MPSYSPLNQLRGLDASSFAFHDQVSNILDGEEYKRWMPNLRGEDLAGLVNYLDKVRHRVSHRFAPRSGRCRLSILSTPPVPPFGSVCASSDVYAAPE